MSNTGPHPLRSNQMPNICGTAVNEPNVPQALIGEHGPEHAHSLPWVGGRSAFELDVSSFTGSEVSPTDCRRGGIACHSILWEKKLTQKWGFVVSSR
jgi:hypothetical protein